MFRVFRHSHKKQNYIKNSNEFNHIEYDNTCHLSNHSSNNFEKSLKLPIYNSIPEKIENLRLEYAQLTEKAYYHDQQKIN